MHNLNLPGGSTNQPITSVSTGTFVPQPVENREHFIQNRIYVGNFPAGTTRKDVFMAFCSFGEIIGTNIVEIGGGVKRFGFVTFRNIASADAVLLHYHQGTDFIIRGYVVKLNRAHFKPKHCVRARAYEQSYRQSSEHMLMGLRYHTSSPSLVHATDSVPLPPKFFLDWTKSVVELNCNSARSVPCDPASLQLCRPWGYYSQNVNSMPLHTIPLEMLPNPPCRPPLTATQNLSSVYLGDKAMIP